MSNERSQFAVDAQLLSHINALDDASATSILALVLEQNGRVLDPLSWRRQENQLREAATDPAAAEFLKSVATKPTEGDLARTARYLSS